MKADRAGIDCQHLQGDEQPTAWEQDAMNSLAYPHPCWPRRHPALGTLNLCTGLINQAPTNLELETRN